MITGRPRLGSLFNATPVVFVRVAMLPAGRADVTRVDLRPAEEGYGDRLVGYLRGLIDDPVVREAIEVSSGSLSETLDRLRDGGRVEASKVERAAFAATRYLLRMCSRPTPFGLLAGVATGSFGDGAKVRIGTAHAKSVRVDAGWLAAFVDDALRRPEVRRRVRVTANALGVVRGDRLVLREGSVRHTPVVASALAHARRPIGYGELCDILRAEFPSTREDAVGGVLAELLERGFLVTDLAPHPAEADPAGRMGDIVAGTDVAAVLSRAREAVAAYRDAPVGGGRAAFRAAVRVLGERPAKHPPVHVDVRYDLDLRLPRAVAAEAERVATAVCLMSREDPGPMAEYHRAFLERYGTHETVPVLELLDPHRGLDAPAGYQMPVSARTLDHHRDEDRADILSRLAWSAACGGGEVVLDDEVVNQLGGTAELPPPPGVELCFQLFADSVAALDRDDFTMALSPAGGATRSGALVGRFAHMLDVRQGLGELIGDDSEGLPVQVFSRPTTSRAGNVSSVPRLVEHSMSMGMFTDGGDGSVIDIADVAVGATTMGLYLASRTSGRLLRPVFPHMLNPFVEMPNAARLLMDIEHARYRPMRWWSWERLECLPSLPRVRYGRTIIAPARWRPDPVLGKAKESWSRWRDRLAEWRDRWAVPATVEATIADHRVELDLDVDLHRQLLRHQLRRDRGLVLSESLAAQRSRLNWLDGHAAEIVVELTRSTSAAPARTEQIMVAPPRSDIRFELGGEWLYTKVYATEPTHDILLTRELPRLLARLPDGIDRWFFVRYRDPEAHIRLRFHGDPPVVNGKLMPLVRDWATRAHRRGMVSRLAIDTYRPEINRYGGPRVIAAAERLFHADSIAVIGQLQRRASARQLRELPIEVLAAMNVVDLLRSLGDGNWMGWTLRAIPRVRLGRIDRRQLRLVDPAGYWDRLADLRGGSELLSCWEQRADVAAEFGRLLCAACATERDFHDVVASVLHMHANRLIGLDRSSENRALAIVRERVHAELH